MDNMFNWVAATEVVKDEPCKKWFFTKEQLQRTPSRLHNIDADEELYQRQQVTFTIRTIGKSLEANQEIMNTAIVYVQRFYMYHSLSMFHRNSIAAAALFLASKVLNKPRRAENIVKAALPYLKSKHAPISIHQCLEDLLTNENILLQTLGFETEVALPFTFIVNFGPEIDAPKKYVGHAWKLAPFVMSLTTMCLEYKAKTIACVCYYMTSKWSGWKIPDVKGNRWYLAIDENASEELLERLTNEFLLAVDKCRLKQRKEEMLAFKQSCEQDRARCSGILKSHKESSRASQVTPATGNASKPGSTSQRATIDTPHYLRIKNEPQVNSKNSRNGLLKVPLPEGKHKASVHSLTELNRNGSVRKPQTQPLIVPPVIKQETPNTKPLLSQSDRPPLDAMHKASVQSLTELSLNGCVRKPQTQPLIVPPVIKQETPDTKPLATQSDRPPLDAMQLIKEQYTSPVQIKEEPIEIKQQSSLSSEMTFSTRVEDEAKPTAVQLIVSQVKKLISCKDELHQESQRAVTPDNNPFEDIVKVEYEQLSEETVKSDDSGFMSQSTTDQIELNVTEEDCALVLPKELKLESDVPEPQFHTKKFKPVDSSQGVNEDVRKRMKLEDTIKYNSNSDTFHYKWSKQQRNSGIVSSINGSTGNRHPAGIKVSIPKVKVTKALKGIRTHSALASNECSFGYTSIIVADDDKNEF